MEGQVSGMRQSTKTSQFADQGYNSGNNLFACPAGASCQICPREITTRRSQRICEIRPEQNSIYEDSTWIRRAR